MRENNPLVSICVPIYGVEKYIERCAVSLFEQTYNNIEYVFVNDCTKDQSMDILKNVIERYPLKKQFVNIIDHNENQGLSGARITAIKSSKGEFISWVDSDDYIENSMIEKLVRRANETGADIISCNTLIHYPNITSKYVLGQCEDSRELILAMLSRRSLRSVWARLIRTSLYLKHDIYPMLGVNNGEDFQVMPRLVYYGKPAYIEDCLYHYNCENTTSYTFKFTRSKADNVWSTLVLLEEFFSDKEDVFITAIKQEKVRTSIRDIVNSCREGYKDYYTIAKKRVIQIDSSITQSLPIRYRLVILINSFTTICYIVKCVDFFSHILKKL